ncbi:PREDICTED: uncharacterized protein LOC107169850 [Diuraphis noxia]|uniref:uncharacterized protein LOC107169850 n=1 Tax=Diuraphis noxia TaxID=143948 RepID=UPI0007639488|nr:PREDICTED: uncharacterized protein LOC107169850 [Diuraphis noxia]
MSEPVVAPAPLPTPTMRPEYRVVPYLSGAMTTFDGDETPLQAEDWLEEIKGMTALNRRPFEYVLQYIRMHLTGPAKDWFAGRDFSDWRELERKFRLVFVRDACAADRKDEMRAWKQGPNETLISSREMALYAVRRTHVDEEELLGDLLNWERMSSLHALAVTPMYVAPQHAEETPTRQLPKKWIEEKASPNEWENFDKTVMETSGSNSETYSASCWVCKKIGHMSRDCPDKATRKPVCYGCGVERNIRPNCPEKDQMNCAEVRPVASNHPYKKIGLVNDREVEVLLDTGSQHSLVKASVAIRCDLRVKPSVRSLYGIGNTIVPSVCALGEVETHVILDGVNPGKVLLLVVPDDVQAPDMIVGRSWLDHPSVAYHKAHGRLYIYEAETCVDSMAVGVTSHAKEDDYLHVLKVDHEPPARQMLDLNDFQFVSAEATQKERSDLLPLVNEYRSCFAKNLDELGCTRLMRVDIREVPGSLPVVSRPYKTTQAYREEIHRIVTDWKRCGVVIETTSPYASPVLLVKQPGKNRLCVNYRRLNKQTIRQHNHMMEQLESLADSRLFAQLDLASGYLQIPLTKEASEKTAFITANTTGEFNRMPFGLSGAVAEFPRLMQRVMSPLQGLHGRNYLDDMVVDGDVNQFASRIGKKYVLIINYLLITSEIVRIQPCLFKLAIPAKQALSKLTSLDSFLRMAKFGPVRKRCVPLKDILFQRTFTKSVGFLDLLDSSGGLSTSLRLLRNP